MQKKVFIISHSHWDREWYMPYEQHHMRLIQLIDDLLEIFEKDPDFDSFHLDGQMIILEDYLQVRPEKKAALQRAINAGKLRIGPFYILQDDFLTSPEANVRNMLVGRELSKEWGTPVMLGYFPDTFGNMGQTPQLMKKADLDVAAFGRGVRPIGFDNRVLEMGDYSSQYSEMWWQGPDQTKILGLLFANWYSNGNEIPSDPKQAKIFWDQKLADAEKFASTDCLLMMNGVDHQPVQKDLTEAIRVANRLYPDYEFIHSNFPEYIDTLKKALPEDLGSVEGELTSQETDGWYTLANTASARVYLKQWNTKVQRQLENITEPLASMAYEVTGKYPHDQLTYAWKTLMQNHPHDSICGCSVDEVHREMLPRFEKANEVGKYLADEALADLVKAVDTSGFGEDVWPFVVFNTSGVEKSGEAEIEVVLSRKTFQEGFPAQLYQELAEHPKQAYHVVDKNGRVIPATISKAEVAFGYDLPKDRFRIPYMKQTVKVRLDLHDRAPFSWETFALVVGEAESKGTLLANEAGTVLENEQLKVVLSEDGTLSVTDKETGVTLDHLLNFEDTGDIGNEYVYKQPVAEKAYSFSEGQHHHEIVANTAEKVTILLTSVLELPVSADERLDDEQRRVIDFTNRKAQRSTEKTWVTLQTWITLHKNSKKIDFETTFNNQIKDHRLRALFPTQLNVATHEADSIFEVVTRPNGVSKFWKNPTNPQHQHAFVNMHDENYGITVGNFGLNEYEVLNNETIALTLLRGVREMGDWGYFPTPEAQCLGQHTFNYSLELHGRAESRYQTYKHAYAAQVPFVTKQTTVHQGQLPTQKEYVNVSGDHFVSTALKRRKGDNELVLRGYNMSDETSTLSLAKRDSRIHLLNLLEEIQPEAITTSLKPYEIRTVGFEEI